MSNLCPQNLLFSWHLLCPMYNFLCLQHSAAYIIFFVWQVPPCFISNFLLFCLFVILLDAAIQEHSLHGLFRSVSSLTELLKMSDLHKMSFRFLLHLKKTLGGCGKQYESSDSIPLCLFKMKDSLDICGWYCVKRSLGIPLTLSVSLDLSSKNSFLSSLAISPAIRCNF